MTSTQSLDAIEMAKHSRRDLEDTANTRAYKEMLSAVRGFQNAVVQANPTPQQLAQMTGSLRQMQAVLEAQALPEDQRWYGRGSSRTGKLQLVTPELTVEYMDDSRIEAHTVAGEFFLGMNSAMHGGVVAAIFDSLLGRMSSGLEARVSRTAYLTTNFKAITPLNQRLDLVASLDSVQRRKRFVSGQIWHDGVLCAEAEALFIELLPGQQ